MGNRRLIAILAPVAAALLILFALRMRDRAPPRAPVRGLLEGEALREVESGMLPPPGPERGEPARLRGSVYRPDGIPLSGAEVWIVVPKALELTRTGEDGSYELPCERSGRHLVEAGRTTDYAPERAWVVVPESGDPPPLDFRLRPAGAVFGEVTVGGAPVEDAGVELYATDIFGDEEAVHDTSVRSGYFNFYFAPPERVPLVLRVKARSGFLPRPLQFSYEGKQVDLGTIALVPYPALRVRMRLPDGSWAESVVACRREDLRAAPDGFHPGGQLADESSWVTVEEERDVAMRLVLGAYPSPTEEVDEGRDGPPVLVEREVALRVGRPQELEVVVRPGPLAVAGRLVDGRGRALRARLRIGGGEVATGEEGLFRAVVPHGGLHAAWIAALDAPGVGWVELGAGAPEHAILLDADARGPECVLDLDARLLVLAARPFAIRFEAEDGEANPLWFNVNTEEGPPVFHLTPRLEPGLWRWGIDDESGRREGRVRVAPDALAVVDAR